MKARSAMTRDVACIAPADDLDAAWRMMLDLQVRHIPVLDGTQLVGILSDRDVLLHAELDDEDEVTVPTIPVAHAMTPAPITCKPGTSVAAVADTMLSKKIDCLPVVDERGNLVGLITSSDLLELLRAHDEMESTRVLPFEYHVVPNSLRALG